VIQIYVFNAPNSYKPEESTFNTLIRELREILGRDHEAVSMSTAHTTDSFISLENDPISDDTVFVHVGGCDDEPLTIRTRLAQTIRRYLHLFEIFSPLVVVIGDHVWETQPITYFVLRSPRKAFFTGEWGRHLERMETAVLTNDLFSVHIPQEEYDRLAANDEAGLEALKQHCSPDLANLLHIYENYQPDGPSIEVFRYGCCPH
jgi:hypothetical protein